MRRGAWLALLLAACTPQNPDAKFTAELGKFDLEYQEAQAELRSVRHRAHYRTPDMRGRTVSDDLNRWVLSFATQDAIRSLRERAVTDGATSRLEEARQMVRAENRRFRQIEDYWHDSTAPIWRQKWQRFSAVNEMPESPPPAQLLDAERRLVAQLDAGDFQNANANGAPRLVAALREAQKSVIPTIIKRRQSERLHFQPRKTRCGAAVAPDRNRRTPKTMGGPPVENFYPRDSLNRGDEGPVVLRLQISDAGCVRAGAILVHSGFTELDEAALKWMETAQFSPGYENGHAIEGLLSIKLLFKIET